MKVFLLAWLSLVCAVGGWAQAQAQTTVFYVALNGNDAWSGKLPAPNATKTDGPLASIEKARDIIRGMKEHGLMSSPVRVLLRGGSYRLEYPFRLEARDSGTAACPITYGAYSGEKVTLSGGRRLTGWKPWHGGIWMCSLRENGLAGLRFRQLFTRGKRQTMARWPNRDPKRPRTGGFLYCDYPLAVDSTRAFRYPRRAFPRPWTRLHEVEVVIYPRQGWHNPKVPIASIDRRQRIITLSQPVGPIKRGNRFYIQNALEELDSPGEWYLDPAAEIVYFYPPDSAALESAVVVPALRNLVILQGDNPTSAFVEHVRLEHLGLESCARHAVVLHAARDCRVVGCTLLGVGRTGIVLEAGCRGCRIAGNDIFHPGAHAIAMRDCVNGPEACTDNVITNTYAHHCGDIVMCSFGWGSGICISGRSNVVSHNLIHDTAYSALCFDGYDQVIEYNHVHHVNLEGQDGDGIYGWVNTKDGSGRNVVRFNRVHDAVGYTMVRPGVWRSPWYALGIRADDYLSRTTIYGNLVYRASFACVCLHGGWDNVVENNILVDGGQGQVRFPNMRRDQPSLSHLTGRAAGAPGEGKWSMSGNVVRRNILAYSSADSAAYQCVVGWEDRILKEADYNLVWRWGGVPDVAIVGWPVEGSWKRWLAGGRDAHSMVADPRFVDPAHDDYRLRPDSPVFNLGFNSLPIGKMGLMKSPERASWPVVAEPEVYRDPPPPLPPPPPPPNMPIGRAYLTLTPPRIDGRLDPAEWGGSAAVPRALIVERLADASGPAPGRALVHALWDTGSLYLGVSCSLADARAIELRIGADSQLSSAGVAVFRGLPSGRLEANGRKGIRFASLADKKRWTCEWRIPFQACGVDISRTDALRFNLTIRRKDPAPAVVWFAGPEGERGGRLRLTPAVSVAARNLLVNGNFEDGTDAPVGWSIASRYDGKLPAGVASPRCVWVKEGRGNSRCLKLEATDARAMTVGECWWNQIIEAPKAGVYVLTYDVRTTEIRSRGALGRFYACGWAAMKEGVTPSGLNLGYSPENQIVGATVPMWTRRECILDVPQDTDKLYLIFGIKHATGVVWIDNVRLEKMDDAE